MKPAPDFETGHLKREIGIKKVKPQRSIVELQLDKQQTPRLQDEDYQINQAINLLKGVNVLQGQKAP